MQQMRRANQNIKTHNPTTTTWKIRILYTNPNRLRIGRILKLRRISNPIRIASCRGLTRKISNLISPRNILCSYQSSILLGQVKQGNSILFITKIITSLYSRQTRRKTWWNNQLEGQRINRPTTRSWINHSNPNNWIGRLKVVVSNWIRNLIQRISCIRLGLIELESKILTRSINQSFSV